MDAVRWQRIQTIFHQAADMPPARRAAFIDAEAAGDADLANDVKRLLDADAEGGAIIDEPLARVAKDIVVDLAPPGVMFGPYRPQRANSSIPYAAWKSTSPHRSMSNGTKGRTTISVATVAG